MRFVGKHPAATAFAPQPFLGADVSASKPLVLEHAQDNDEGGHEENGGEEEGELCKR